MSKDDSAQEVQRRRAVWEQLCQLQAQVAGRNADLDERQAEALAAAISDEAMGSLTAKGKVRFER